MLFGNIKEKTLNRVIEVNINSIDPNPHQPRRWFEESDLESLAQSIKQNGILQPLTVRKIGDRYELVSGERRLRALKLIEKTMVPCIVIDISERNSAVMALVENIQRKDLSYFDEAVAISNLIDFYGMTQEDAAIKLGRAQSTIANKLRLLKFSEEEKELILKYGLTERHARALLKMDVKEERMQMIEQIYKFSLNVEKTEKAINDFIYQKIADKKSIFKSKKYASKDVRIFVNSINHAIESMQAAGINAKSTKRTSDDYIEYVVRIPIESKNDTVCAV